MCSSISITNMSKPISIEYAVYLLEHKPLLLVAHTLPWESFTYKILIKSLKNNPNNVMVNYIALHVITDIRCFKHMPDVVFSQLIKFRELSLQAQRMMARLMPRCFICGIWDQRFLDIFSHVVDPYVVKDVLIANGVLIENFNALRLVHEKWPLDHHTGVKMFLEQLGNDYQCTFVKSLLNITIPEQPSLENMEYTQYEPLSTTESNHLRELPLRTSHSLPLP